MVVVSYSGREINAKIVYYGPGLSGKTTNLEKIYDSVPETNRGRMVSMKTQTDRTLFFDLLPLDLGDLQGMKTRLLLYTVPGQVYYNATRKLVLKGVDAVVFVADSAADKMAENRESLANLEMNLKAYGIDIKSLPWVLQLNKRDLPNAAPVEDMVRELNRHNAPVYEAQAANGVGVFETLRGVSKLLLAKITKDVLEKDRGSLSRASGAKTAAGDAAADAPTAGKAESTGPGGKILKFLKRGKEEPVAAQEPEPAPESERKPEPAASHPPPMMYDRDPFEEPVPASPEPSAEEAPLLADADLLDETPAPIVEPDSGDRRPQNAEEELTLNEQDFIRPGSPNKEDRGVRDDVGEIRTGTDSTAPRPAPHAVAPEDSGEDSSEVRRITVPVDLGELPSSGRVTLTFEVRIQVDPTGTKPRGKRGRARPEAGIDESFTHDVEVIR